VSHMFRNDKLYQKAYSMVELMVVLALLGVIAGGVALVAGNFYKKSRQIRYQSLQWDAYKRFELISSGQLGDSIYFTFGDQAGAGAPGPFGVESWPYPDPESEDDAILVYSFSSGNRGVSFQLRDAVLQGGGTSTIEVSLDPSQSIPLEVLQDEKQLLVAAEGRTALARIQSVSLQADYAEIVVEPALPDYFNNPGGFQTRPVAIPIQADLYFAQSIGGGQKDLRIISDRSRQEFTALSSQEKLEQSRLLISDLQKFQVYYKLMPKNVAAIGRVGDPCNPESMGAGVEDFRFNSTAWNLAGCNYNNLVYTKVLLEYDARHPENRSTSEELNLMDPIFSSTPSRFDPRNWGSANYLDLSGPASNCDGDNFEHLRCKPECADFYTNNDWKPGSPYCLCKGDDNFNSWQIATHNSRWQNCCLYRNKLEAQSGQICWNSCTHMNRVDNPWFAYCLPNICGRYRMLNTCRFEDADSVTQGVGYVQGLCDPLGSDADPSFQWSFSGALDSINGKCGNEVSGPINCDVEVPSKYVNNQEKIISIDDGAFGLNLDLPGVDYPDTNEWGWISSGPGAGKYLVLRGQSEDPADLSPACKCAETLFFTGSSRQISLPGGYNAIYPDGAALFPYNYPNWKDRFVAHAGDMDYFENLNPAAVNNYNNVNGRPQICWDPIWGQSDGETTNFCKFEFDDQGGENHMIRRPGPIPNFPASVPAEPSPGGSWGATSRYCACELAGMPLDALDSTAANFYGYVPSKDNDWFVATKGQGSCACLNPQRASISLINTAAIQAQFPSCAPGGVVDPECAQEAMEDFCGLGGGGTTGGSEDTGGASI